jgi:Tol biopolymer transport system component
MGVDERLGGALRAAAGELPSRPGDWDQVRGRARRRRRRRQFSSAGVLVVALVAVVAGLVWFRGGSTTNGSVVAAPPAAGERIVAAFGDRIVLLSVSDGHVLRTLVEGPQAAGARTVAPTPDGVWVYFGQGSPTCGDQSPTIWRVRASGGPVEAVAAGWAPRVSPDGRFLAYAAPRAGSQGCVQPGELVVRDLTNGTEQRLDNSSDIPGFTPLAWSPDSTRLVLVNPPITYQHVEVTGTGLRQLEPPRLPPGNGVILLGDGELVTSLPTPSTTRIVAVDPATGDTRRTLVEVGAPLFLIAADSSGSRFLLTGPLSDAPDGHDLYSASVEQPAPTKLASNVYDATWFPNREPEPPPTSSSEPTTTTTTSSPSTPRSAARSDERAARDEIIKAFTTWGAVGTVEEAEAHFDLIDDTHGIREAAEQAVRNYPYEVAHDSYRVSNVRFPNRTAAVVVYDILIDGVPRFVGRTGQAVLVDGKWKITRETICSDLSLSGATCPP